MTTAIDIPVRTWAGPSKRPDLKMKKGDIALALADFKMVTGKDANFIILNPKNAQFAGEVPEGIEVRYCAGCLGWEVMLGGDNKAATSLPSPLKGTTSDAGDCNTGKGIENVVQGDVTGNFKGQTAPELVKTLSSQGMSSRKIAEVLQAKGFQVSHMTISRWVKNYQLVML